MARRKAAAQHKQNRELGDFLRANGIEATTLEAYLGRDRSKRGGARLSARAQTIRVRTIYLCRLDIIY